MAGFAVAVLILVAGVASIVWMIASRRRGAPLLSREGCAVVPLGFAETVQSVSAILSDTRGVKSCAPGPEKQKVTAKIGMGIRSFGENIEATMTSAGPGETLVHVVSTPIFSTALFDYGKNKSNVQGILRSLVAAHGGHISETADA